MSPVPSKAHLLPWISIAMLRHRDGPAMGTLLSFNSVWSPSTSCSLAAARAHDRVARATHTWRFYRDARL